MMAVILAEGFDHYLPTTFMTNKGWSGNVAVTGAGRWSGNSARQAAGAGSVSKTLPSTYTTLIAGFAINLSGWGNANTVLFAFRNNVTLIATIVLNPNTGKVSIQNNGGTNIGQGTTQLTLNIWWYMEFKIFVNTGTPASGTCELRLNGNGTTPEIASTTGNFGSTVMDTIALGAEQTSTGVVFFDDIYVVDTSGSAPRNTWLGDSRIVASMPTADGAHSAWTPNSGSPHFSRVNEVSGTYPDSDTSYVGDSGPGDIDTYATADVDTNATIYAVQTNIFARKDDVTLRQIADVQRQASTDYVGTTQTLGATYTYYTSLYNQDPTGADWTPTNFNADEFGVKLVA